MTTTTTVPETFAPDPAPIRLTATLVRAWDIPAPAGDAPLVESTTSGHMDAHSVNDWGGHKFIADREMLGQSNDSWANLWRYRVGAPAPEAYWQVLPPPDSEDVGYKLDSISLCPNGDGTMEVWMNAHQKKSGTRKSCLAFAVVPDAGWVSGPHGQLEAAGGPFNLTALQGGDPGPAPAPGGGLTKDEVRAVVIEALQLAVGAGDLPSIFRQLQKAAKNGASQALDSHPAGAVPAYLQDQNTYLQVLRDGLAPFIRDRAYEGDMAAEVSEPKTGKTTAAATGEPGGIQTPPPTGHTDSGDVQP